MRHHAAAALVFAALSLGMTWPLAVNLGRAVSDPGDPYITIWVLDWDWWATLHAPLSLFDANSFYPARDALAYSEHLYGLALLLFPLRLVGAGPVVAHNLGLLAGYAFCGFAAYLLGRRLTGSWAAGMAAGIYNAFVPFRFIHLPHIQHIWGGWLPLLLLMLLRYAERPTRRRAIAFAAVFLMNGLTNVHYLFFGAFAAAVTALALVPRRSWRELGAATAGALVLLAPFLYPYAVVAKLYGMQRGWDEVLQYSAFASDWVTSSWREGHLEPERWMFPGWLAYALCAAALAVAWRRREARAPLALGLLWIAIGFLGSLGLHFEFHRFLFGAVPGFRAIRAPARWAVIAYVGMAILIALTTAEAARRFRQAAIVIPLALSVALWAGPIRFYLFDPVPNPVYLWLAQQRVRAIAEVPIHTKSSEYEYLLRATVHHAKIVNGISGFAPPQWLEFAALWEATPIPDRFVDRLRESGVELLVVHADTLGGRSAETRAWLRRELDRGRLTFVRDFDTDIEGDWVFRIGGRTGGMPRPARLETFLSGVPTCGSGTMGALDFPQADYRFGGGNAIFSGWAMSPHGIRQVDLWFDNHTYRHRANLMPQPQLQSRCAGDPRFTRLRYIAVFGKRPPAIRPDTDIQVEVTDGRGVKAVFDDRWIRWE
jgi:hypothetical protein